MSQARRTERGRAGARIRAGGLRVVLVALFCLVIILPQASQWLGFSPQANFGEKRTLAPRPQLDFGSGALASFPARFGEYYLDNFNLRPWLIRLHSWFTYFGLGMSPVPEVVLGKDGWLFYAATNDGDPLADFQGRNLFSSEELADVCSRLRAWRSDLKARGIALYVLLVPNKNDIYPEYLPNRIKRLGGQTRLGQFVREMRRRGFIGLVDGREPLLRAKERTLAYFKTDTHWNAWGALSGYAALAERMSADFPAVPTLDLSQYKLSLKTIPGGDLAQMMDLGPQLSDQAVVVSALNPNRGAAPKGAAEKRGAKTRPRVLLYGDSFSWQLLPYFRRDFPEVVFAKYLEQGQGLISKETPGVVIVVLVERYLGLWASRLPGG